MKVQAVLDNLAKRFPNEPEYLQAVEEVLTSIEDVYNQHPEFEKVNLIMLQSTVAILHGHSKKSLKK